MSDKSLEFNAEDVVISEDGRVVINNKDFAKKLVDHVKMVSPDNVGIFDNCDCKKGNALSEVNLGKILPATKLKFDTGVANIRETAGIFDNCDCGKGREKNIREVLK